MDGRCCRRTKRIRKGSTTSPACCRCRRRCSRTTCPPRETFSRMAVGDLALRPVIESFKISKALVQDERLGDDLPFGSRGGALDSPLLSARRRIHDQSPAAAAGIRLHHRHGRAASARFPARWRASQAVFRRRRSEGDDRRRRTSPATRRAIRSSKNTCTRPTRISRCACR